MPDHAAAQGRDDPETISVARARIEVLAQYVDTEQAVAALEALADLAETLLAENEKLRELAEAVQQYFRDDLTIEVVALAEANVLAALAAVEVSRG